jgi:hypothetical protein
MEKIEMSRFKKIFFCCVILFPACSRKTVPTTSILNSKPSVVETPIFKDTIVHTQTKENYKPYITPVDEKYWKALSELEQMYEIPEKLNFKQAVFLSENVYFDGKLSYDEFNKEIETLAQICRLMIKANKLTYPFEDSSKVAVYAAVFRLMMDGVPIINGNNDTLHFPPCKYAFDDFAGSKYWEQMFVAKLLITHTGNCHSIPFLYKILVQEFGENASLALAPNHIYIKTNNKKAGWYNTELTSGAFPNDSWLMASGYIKLDAIQNGIYMKALDDKQSIAICVTDLAQGYEKKFGVRNGDFIFKCCDLALKQFPNYINGLLLKAETQKKLLDAMMKSQNAKSIKELLSNPKAKQLYGDMNKNYATIYKLGYRKMPDKMYSDWLISLKTEKEKYQNKNLNFTNSNTKSK